MSRLGLSPPPAGVASLVYCNAATDCDAEQECVLGPRRSNKGQVPSFTHDERPDHLRKDVIRRRHSPRGALRPKACDAEDCIGSARTARSARLPAISTARRPARGPGATTTPAGPLARPHAAHACTSCHMTFEEEPKISTVRRSEAGRTPARLLSQRPQHLTTTAKNLSRFGQSPSPVATAAEVPEVPTPSQSLPSVQVQHPILDNSPLFQCAAAPQSLQLHAPRPRLPLHDPYSFSSEAPRTRDGE